MGSEPTAHIHSWRRLRSWSIGMEETRQLAPWFFEIAWFADSKKSNLVGGEVNATEGHDEVLAFSRKAGGPDAE